MYLLKKPDHWHLYFSIILIVLIMSWWDSSLLIWARLPFAGMIIHQSGRFAVLLVFFSWDLVDRLIGWVCPALVITPPPKALFVGLLLVLEVLQIVLIWKFFCMSFGKHVLVCVFYTARGGIARSYGMLICAFSRHYQTVFKVVLPIHLHRSSIWLPLIAVQFGQ